MDIQNNSLLAVNTFVQQVKFDGTSVIRVIKNKKLDEFDENTYAKIDGLTFHNGVFEVHMLSRLLADAPEYARGFIGIAFRIDQTDTSFESFYIRPTNGRTTDQLRASRAFQYFSYPDYTFDYFRNNGITDFEGAADIGLDEWIKLRVVVKDSQAHFYLNDSPEPTLTVKNLILGPKQKGQIGFFVDTGTEALFKNFKCINWD